jgi:hypothetical protein
MAEDKAKKVTSHEHNSEEENTPLTDEGRQVNYNFLTFGSETKLVAKLNTEYSTDVIFYFQEKFYNCLYTRRQYRTIYGQKCSKRVEMILDMKTKQLV